MPYRCIMAESKAHLSIKNQQLVISGNLDKHTVPLEDIAALLVENRQSTASFAALSAACEYGIAVIVCKNQAPA